MSNPHSHKTIGKQVTELVAERDRLKEFNLELLEVLKEMLIASGVSETYTLADNEIQKRAHAAITKATQK